MTRTIEQIADQAVKAKHRALWASGDYPAVAAELIPGERVAALDREFLELLTTWNRSEVPGRTAYPAEYLLFTASKR